MNKAASRFVLPAAVGASLLAAVASAQQPAPHEPEEEYGEWLAAPAELATVPIDRIPRSLRLNGQAMILGQKVFAEHCAGCHGANLKGLPEQHTPDLTDAEWRLVVTISLRVEQENILPTWNGRFVTASAPETRTRAVRKSACSLSTRNTAPRKTRRTSAAVGLSTLKKSTTWSNTCSQISGRPFDKAKAARGDVLFHDGAKGNCYDCHGDNGAGIDTFGSANLTRPDLYLYGADRGSIRESIIKGRHGKMPAFGGVLKPEELKAVSIYVFSRAAQK